MILSQPDIRDAVSEKRIVFDPPLAEDQWGQASVDLRLGFTFVKWRDGIQNLKVTTAQGLNFGGTDLWTTMKLRERNDFDQRETCTLKSGDFVLAMTHEKVTIPPDLIGLVEGRSTYARLGLSMHQTAPWIQPGWTGAITLEIRNSGPLTLELTPLLDRPCQLTFLQLSTAIPPAMLYGTHSSDVYQDQRHPLKPQS